MDKQISFRVIKHSDAVEAYINKQMEKVEDFLTHERQPIHIAIVLQPSKLHAHHRVEIRVKNPDFFVIADFEGPEFYKVIDRAVDSIYHRLHEKKRQIVEKNQGKA